MARKTLTITTHGQGLYEFTQEVENALQAWNAAEGLLTLYVQHTSCSLLIQENADPDVLRDLKAFFGRIVPPTSDASMGWVRHRSEGPDDMPAHIKTTLTQTSVAVPVGSGAMMLGTWQGIYLFEHRDRPHDRKIVLHYREDD